MPHSQTNPPHVKPLLDYGNIIEAPKQAFTGNCENIIGFTPIPLGVAGPVVFKLGNQLIQAQLPLATTEACLVASVNRGFKTLREAKVDLKPQVTEVGITRSAAFQLPAGFDLSSFEAQLKVDLELLNKLIAQQSQHTKLLRYETEQRTNILFINFYYYTGQAMGMNMATIATKHLADTYFSPQHGLELITVSANWCSDKKPSQQTVENGRKFKVDLEAIIPAETIESVLKTTAEKIAIVDVVKLRQGSDLAGGIGQNAHHANIVAASFLALGQDAAHTVDGSLGSSYFTVLKNGNLHVRIEIPALVCGTVGGGTSLNVQQQTLALTGLAKNKNGHLEATHLAALIGCGVLAGELSLMAALASQSLAESHAKLRRKV